MEVNDPDAKLDGGDVLYTGREILVGLSSRTNRGGLEAVRQAFPGFIVLGIEVAGPLHLKTLLTLCGEDTLLASVESGDSFKMLQVHLKIPNLESRVECIDFKNYILYQPLLFDFIF